MHHFLDSLTFIASNYAYIEEAFPNDIINLHDYITTQISNVFAH